MLTENTSRFKQEDGLRRAVNVLCGVLWRCLVALCWSAPFLQGSRDLQLPSTELRQKFNTLTACLL